MDLHKTVKEFLSHAETCVSKGAKNLSNLQSQPFAIVKGVIFLPDEKFNSLQKQCITLIEKKYKKSHISPTEISSLLNNSASEQVRSEEDQTHKVLSSFDQILNSEIQYLVPNHAVSLTNGLENFSIGPVQCVFTNNLKTIFPEKLSSFEIIVDEDKTGLKFSPNSQDFYLPEQSFIITVKCSPKRAPTLSQWYIDVALSILRLYLYKHKAVHGHFPYNGDLDPIPFRQRERQDPTIMIYNHQSQDSLQTGFMSHCEYELDKNTAALLLADDFEEICSKIYSSSEKLVSNNIQKALGWMTKARRSNELATRFLFFFTALEALLTEERGVPIADTIARNVATIIGKPDSRYFLYKKMKSLYETRSALIHSGNIEVSEIEANTLQYYTEVTCLEMIENALDEKTGDFRDKLKIAGFGSEWKSEVLQIN